jgi:hypothetical protein
MEVNTGMIAESDLGSTKTNVTKGVDLGFAGVNGSTQFWRNFVFMNWGSMHRLLLIIM